MTSNMRTVEQVLSGLRNMRPEPLWQLLPTEAAVTPHALDGNYSLDSNSRKRLLSIGATMDIYHDIISYTSADVLSPDKKEFLLSDSVHVVGNPEFIRDLQSIGAVDGAVISYSEGMDVFLVSVAMSLASIFKQRGTTSQTQDIEQVGRSLGYQLSWSTSLALRPRSLPSYVDEDQLSVAESLFRNTKRFIVAHEIAHLIIGHAWDPLPVTLEEKFAEMRTREFEADQLALSLLLTASRPDNEFYTDETLAGADLFFLVEHMVEIFSDEPHAKTHPTAADRLSAIIQHPLRTNLPNYATNLPMQVGRMMDAILPYVEAFSSKAIVASGQQRGEVYRKQFEALIKKFSGSFPDYTAFARKAEELLDEAPAIVLEAVRDFVLEDKKILRSNPDESSRQQVLERQRLIATFASRLPDDVREKLGVA